MLKWLFTTLPFPALRTKGSKEPAAPIRKQRNNGRHIPQALRQEASRYSVKAEVLQGCTSSCDPHRMQPTEESSARRQSRLPETGFLHTGNWQGMISIGKAWENFLRPSCHCPPEAYVSYSHRSEPSQIWTAHHKRLESRTKGLCHPALQI